MCKSFLFSTFLSAFVIFYLFPNSHSNWVIYLLVVSMHISWWLGMWACLHIPVGRLCVFFWEMSTQIICLFLRLHGIFFAWIFVVVVVVIVVFLLLRFLIPYMFWILIPCSIDSLKIYSPILQAISICWLFSLLGRSYLVWHDPVCLALLSVFLGSYPKTLSPDQDPEAFLDGCYHLEFTTALLMWSFFDHPCLQIRPRLKRMTQSIWDLYKTLIPKPVFIICLPYCLSKDHFVAPSGSHILALPSVYRLKNSRPT
jgi:hypothetical protein